MSLLAQGLGFLEHIGLSDFILPFMLIFTLVFVTLMKAGIFGDKLTRINSVIALALSLMATRFVGESISFTSLISKVALILVILFVFQFVLATINIKISVNDSAAYQILLLVALIVITMHEFGIIMGIVDFFSTLNLVGVIEIVAFLFITAGVVILVYKIPSKKTTTLHPLVTEGEYEGLDNNDSDAPARSSNAPTKQDTTRKPTEDEFEEFVKKLRNEGNPKHPENPDKHAPRKLVEVDLPGKKKKR